ncbi:MAG: peroxiredoxin [Rhizobiales bacterium]|nr:peroxiredoxin [Hyphomicrobiales bacterium]MBA68758.1 peroxiredoxin [Hyphomicrobiales bacterium]|tara:strand:- start:366 stop:836 length:471 start_codon:yes stop_codon:yes gene_type:complete
MAKPHDFTAKIRWTGNRGDGTRTYRGYDRTWNIVTDGKAPVECSNDPLLGGDPAKHNPEDLLIASLASCHMLWYLHLASTVKIAVQSYVDDPVGHGESEPDGTGRFLAATLRPRIEVPKGTDLAKAEALHHEVHKYCFIARSVNFPVRYEPTFIEI